MNLAKLFMYQSELENHIETVHPRKTGESRHDKKVLALLQELGELCRETRFFKFWSHDQEPRRSEMLKEIVDPIHFLLSLGLENNIEELNIKPIKRDTLTKQFISLYNVFSGLDIYFSTKAYSDAWGGYVGLIDMLGFTWTEVEEEYLKKNKINHERANNGY